MKITMLNLYEFEVRFKSEKAFIKVEETYRPKWIKTRNGLNQRLKQLGKEDKTGYGRGGFVRNKDWVEYDGGDFHVVDEWTGNKILSVLILHWEWFTRSVVVNCIEYQSEHQDYCVSIEKAPPIERHQMFKIILATATAYMCLPSYRKGKAWQQIQTRNEYQYIRSLVENI